MPLLLSPFTPVFDLEGRLAFGAKVHVFQAGTTTPASIYVDAGFDVRHANPVETERGILPPVYVPAGSYRLQAVGEYGDELTTLDDVVIASVTSEGGGGGDPTDPASVFATGDLKHRYGTGPLAGWVRLNGRSIGSTNSNGTERANDDCEDLFVFLWAQDVNLAVSGGRGASADEDWAADKTIALPDARNRVLAGLAAMGGNLVDRLTGAVFDFGGPNDLGSYGGRASHTITLSQMPAHAHTASVTVNAVAGHNHPGTTDTAGQHGHPGGTAQSDGVHSHTATSAPAGAHSHDYATAQSKIGTAGSGGVITNLWNGPNVTATSSNEANHQHTINVQNGGAHSHDLSIPQNGNHSHSFTTNIGGSHTHVATATVNSAGTGTAHNIAQPFLLTTIYIKL